MTASAITSTASGYGSYDLLTFVTGCSRHRVHLLLPIQPSCAVVLSQVCLNRTSSSHYQRDDRGIIGSAGYPEYLSGGVA
jgi:hypothetical protein